MKKIISILLAALLMFSLLLTACKAPEVNIGEDGVPLANNADSRNKQGDYIASQEILDELYKEHLALRDLPANLTSAQIDYMLALGADEKTLATITNGEVADLLAIGEIVKPQYIMKYIDEGALVNEIADSKAKVEKMLQERGLSDTQIKLFFEYRLKPWDYVEDKDNTHLLADLAEPRVHPKTTSCHIFSGTRSTNLLGENNVHFHQNSFPSSSVDNYGQTITLPKSPTEGTLAYTIKCDILSDHLNDVSKMALKLYNRTDNVGTNYNYYLWTEESSSTSNSYHEGVDLNRGSGASLYSICDGTIIGKIVGSSTSLSAFLVYNSTHNVTVQYLHGNWSAASSGSISKGALIGSEDKRANSTVGYHTHIQIVSGSDTNIPAQDANIGSVKPYAYFWIWSL